MRGTEVLSLSYVRLAATMAIRHLRCISSSVLALSISGGVWGKTMYFYYGALAPFEVISASVSAQCRKGG